MVSVQSIIKDPTQSPYTVILVTVRGGRLSFERLIGDHRGLWMDIPNKLIYGINPPPLTHPNARKLKMKDPRRVKRYNDRLHEECERAHMYHRMDTLHHNATDSLTKFQQQEYEQLDMELCKMMEIAKQKCRKLCVG